MGVNISKSSQSNQFQQVKFQQHDLPGPGRRASWVVGSRNTVLPAVGEHRSLQAISGIFESRSPMNRSCSRRDFKQASSFGRAKSVLFERRHAIRHFDTKVTSYQNSQETRRETMVDHPTASTTRSDPWAAHEISALSDGDISADFSDSFFPTRKAPIPLEVEIGATAAEPPSKRPPAPVKQRSLRLIERLRRRKESSS